MPPNTTGQLGYCREPPTFGSAGGLFYRSLAGAIKVGPRKFSPFSGSVRQARWLRGFFAQR